MGYIYPNSQFTDAQTAFVMLYDYINRNGVEQGNDTKSLINFGFYISNPTERYINVEWRAWNKENAHREWSWHLSNNTSVEDLKKYIPAWDKKHNGNNQVNSNYGFIWNQNEQMTKVIKALKSNLVTQDAWITFYDGKLKNKYSMDAPGALNVGFKIINNKVYMTVLMRSSDLWTGFCNDQYFFSRLQDDLAHILGLEVGYYYYYAADLYICKEHYNIQDNFYKQLSLFDDLEGQQKLF